ncbi:MAG TPA: M12 family metallopeptidase [Verrucomicrobiae bacterium]
MHPNASGIIQPGSANDSPKRIFARWLLHLRVRAALAGLALPCLVALTASGQYSRIIVPAGYVQVEGDIIVAETNLPALLGENIGPHAKFAYAPSRLWQNGIVPYDYGSALSGTQIAVFNQAMSWWANSYPNVTTLCFQSRNNEAGYINFVVTDPGFVGGVTDYVGYSGDKVTITIHPSAIDAGVIAHEIGHALGLWHEQSRADRDNYVTILWANILDGEASQFDIKSPQAVFGDYDYDSIMHYFACAFSKCDGQNGHATCACTDAACITIQVIPPYAAQQCRIGQQSYLSGMDRRAMAFRYGPSDWFFLYATPSSTATGRFEQPYTSVSQAVASMPPSSTLWLGPGSFSAAGQTISTPMILKAAIPDLQLQSDGSLGPSPSGYATLR